MIQAARSVHLWFPRGPFAECYLRARIDRFAPGSYFSALAFEGGYFGIQELCNREHVAIFSLWHDGEVGHRSIDDMVWAHGIGDQGFVRSFGGEGEGFQSFIPFNWRIGEEIEFRLTTECSAGRTCISALLWRAGSWQLVSSLSRHGESRLIDGWYSFVEDFRRDGRSPSDERCVTIVDAWARRQQGQWYPIADGKSSADNTPVMNFNVKVENNCWVMETGGGASNTTPLQSNLHRTTANLESPPSIMHKT